MNIYLISQETNKGYDTYDSAVVFAESEEEAMQISTSISKRDMFVVCEVNECFTPHDYEEQLELQRKLIDKFPSKE